MTETQTEQVDPSRSVGDRGEVVCAVLGGGGDEAAAQLGARLAELLSLRVALVRVEYLPAPHDAVPVEGLHPLAPVPPISPVPPQPLPDDPVAASEPAEPEEWERDLVTSQPLRHDTFPGPPGEALRTLSEARGTRVLVACDYGGGPLSSKLTGNAARDAVRDVRCPLVLVAPDHTVKWSAAPGIVCGIDEDEESAAVAGLAEGLAQRLGGRLHVVHVAARPLSEDPPCIVELEALDDNRRRSTEAAFEACRAAMSPDADASFVAVEGDTADGLRFAARELDAGLIVIGRPSHTSLGSALLGSSAHDLLRDGGLAVVIAPHLGPEALSPWTGSPEQGVS
ncbi:MAG: universal stress protein [Solirubrobacteraceae bacterium]